GVEPRRDSVGNDCRRRRRQALAKVGQGMLQAVSRLLVASIAPQEASELVPRLDQPSWQSQDSQQSAILLPEVDRLTVRQAQLETAEKREFSDCHGAWAMPLLPTNHALWLAN